MRILVTGADGFVGRHCLRRLNRTGVELHAVHHPDYPPGDFDGSNCCEWHAVDLLDEAAVSRFIFKPFHPILFICFNPVFKASLAKRTYFSHIFNSYFTIEDWFNPPQFFFLGCFWHSFHMPLTYQKVQYVCTHYLSYLTKVEIYYIINNYRFLLFK